MRHRLRFHLQEVDLPRGEVLIGRGPECHVTVDDPMLSRQHALIDLSGDAPFVEDLESRNGTQLNGAPLVGRAPLQDGDRIRLGTQELVFVVERSGKRNFRTTSGLIFCTACAVPYPSSSFRCPHCGETAEEHTDESIERDVPASGWTFHLLAQAVGRAIDQGRLADAERMLSRGLSELEDQLDAGVEVKDGHVAELADCAEKLGRALDTSRWHEQATRLRERAEALSSREAS